MAGVWHCRGDVWAISFAALSMFDSMDELFQSDAEPAPIPNLVFESLNRSDVEGGLVNETGWFNLNDHRGSVIVLDLMARDCSNCHACLLYTSPSPRDAHESRMPSSA